MQPVRTPMVRFSRLGAGFLLSLMTFALPAVTAEAQILNREITDDRIRFALEDMLAVDPGVDAQLVDIAVRDGIVRLDGYVETVRARDRAQRLAEAMRGVRAVENGIGVRPAERPDAEIQQDLLAAIEADPVLDAKDIQIEVHEGSVRLIGAADSWGQKHLFYEAISGIRGIRNIENNLKIGQTAARDERKVAREIQRRLARGVWTQDANVRVDVRDGIAHLNGTVHSPAQRSRVEDAAFIRGIRALDTSRLQVVPDLGRGGLAGGGVQRPVRVTAMRDQQVAEEVQAAFALDPRLETTNIEVQADGGAIRLMGEVPSYFAKQAAEQDALSTVGVFHVENRLRVRPASALPSDDELATRVEQALTRDVDTHRMNIQLDVRNGKVRLMGFVDTPYEQQLAEEVASRVAGVIALENSIMTSGAGRGMDDSQLRAAIEEQLWWNPYVDVSTMTFNVRDGEVIITGESPAYLKSKLVGDVAVAAGARNVTNHLQLPRD